MCTLRLYNFSKGDLSEDRMNQECKEKIINNSNIVTDKK